MGKYSTKKVCWRCDRQKADDWTCTYGRVYRIASGPQGGRWYWSMIDCPAGANRQITSCHGVADTQEETFRQVRASWEAVQLTIVR